MNSNIFPVTDHTSLFENPTIFSDVKDNSLFVLFKSGDQDTILANLQLSLIKELVEEYLCDVNEIECTEYKLNFLQRCIVEEFDFDGETEESKQFNAIIDYLVSKELDLNYQDIDGRTALHIAVSENQFELGEFLVSKGAKTTIKDNDGHTAYDNLARFLPQYMSDDYRARRQKMLNILKMAMESQS